MPRNLLALLTLLILGAPGRADDLGDSSDYFAGAEAGALISSASDRPAPPAPARHARATEAVPMNPRLPLHSHAASKNGCRNGRCCPGVCRHPGHPAKPHHEKPGDIDRGDCPPKRYRMNDCDRAGHPHRIARWARCGIDDKYSAWFVGGGSAFCTGRPRRRSEGTWGLDYGGFFGRAKVWLKYTHGRPQGGTGAYQTDGEPELIGRAKSLLHPAH